MKSGNYIEFVSVKASNFLSIGTEPVEVVFKKGLNIIQGINKDKSERSNGSGKSTVMESIYFALFGKTMKKLTKSDIVNWKTKKGTEVELVFRKGGVEYKIVRKIKPSELNLFIDGKDKTRNSTDNTENDIIEILGVSEDIVKNCVIMSINKTTPFMAQGKVDRRKFIEGIFDLSIFSDMLKIARNEYNDKSKELTVLETKNNEKIKNLEVYKEHSEKFEDNQKTKIDTIELKYGSTERAIDNLKAKKREVEDSIDKYDPILEKIDNKIAELETKIRETNSEIGAHNGSINNLQKQIKNAVTGGSCPTCLRTITDDDSCNIESKLEEFRNDISTMEKSIGSLGEGKLTIRGKIAALNGKKGEIKDKCREIQNIIRENADIDNDIKLETRQLSFYQTQITALKAEKNTFEKTIADISEEIHDNEASLAKLNEEIDVLDKVKFITSENGVKSFIVKKMLSIFNTKINHYLQKLNANCSIIFNEYFEEVITNDKKQTCSYHNFSSGEARNIDISIMLAFMDIQRLQGNFDTNLATFDELIDGSLDEDGVNYILDILNNIIDIESKYIYLISHRKEANKYASGDVIKLEKLNGITKRIK